ncbi:MAG: hypothetical protein IKW01_04210 [Firmicutes bacterium]|nr:hypothetical protein [Bacillota bacterium]
MPKQINRNQDFTFSIKKHLGVLSTASTGWTKEVNLVEWNSNAAKLDIREWDPDHEHMSRGITLHKPETLALLEILIKAFGKDLKREAPEAAVEKAEEVQAEEMQTFAEN